MDVLPIFALVYLMSFGCLALDPESRDLTKEEECFAQEKIYYEPEDKCYKLLTKGPCPQGEWFVAAKPTEFFSLDQLRIEGKCVKEKCMDGEFYWPETKSCVKPEDEEKLCGKGNNEELQYNIFGEGECSCGKQPPSGRLGDHPYNACYALYRSGPCQPGQVLGIHSVERVPACIADPCYQSSMELRETGMLSPTGALAPWRDNLCYELGTKGPCPIGMTFDVHPKFKVPSCVSLKNDILSIPRQPDPDCYADEHGNCQKVVTYREEVKNKFRQAYIDGMMREIMLQRKKNKTDEEALERKQRHIFDHPLTCLPGYMLDENKICQKVISGNKKKKFRVERSS